ncbi:MAG: type I methionyl aminopeptidase [Actinomycetota bacterium]|nr:type I methionyl aminopeptidase [Actinomycetota bacterium]
MRTVPAAIDRPDYADSGVSRRRPEPRVKSDDVLERMRRTGKLAATILRDVGAAVTPGITTEELDILAHEMAVAAGAYPSPLNYDGFPKAICTSVNEVICHGIPDSRKLAEGDICNIDVTVFREGVHGDTNATFYVGDVDETTRRLVETTRECLELGIAAVRPGRPVSDIGRAIEDHATGRGFGVVKTFVGHGIGEQFHTDLQIPHYYTPGASTVLEPNMTFTIEPMITVGNPREVVWDDGWTAVTADRKRSAQFEHTLVVTPDGAEILTVAD